MGDSTSMTIEFLRARLLSERSVSMSARQRADQLAKRVVELEEQIRTVVIQRKKAEKAAQEVLAILDIHGIGDQSEVIDSSTDQDVLREEPKRSDNAIKEEESSNASIMDKSEVDDGYSGSELEVSPSDGRSLSWKGSRGSSESLERKKLNQTRQKHRGRRYMYVTESSPKHHLGKSCRKTKKKEMGATPEDEKETTTPHDVKENKATLQADDAPTGSENQYVVANESAKENNDEAVLCSAGSPIKSTHANFYANGIDDDEEMQLALEKQARLIDQFQAEEIAQRAWEERFNENNLFVMESSKPEKKSTKMEAIEKLKDEASVPTEHIMFNDKQVTSSETANSCNLLDTVTADEQKTDCKGSQTVLSSSGEKAIAISSGFTLASINTVCNARTLHVEASGSIDQRFGNTIFNVAGCGHQELKFPDNISLHKKETKDRMQGPLVTNFDPVSRSSSRIQPHDNGSFDTRSIEYPPAADSSIRFSQGQLLDDRNVLHGMALQAPKNDLREVLDALQRAKLSLKQELHRPLQPNHTTCLAKTDIQIHDANANTSDLGVPLGSAAAMFRLPSDPTALAGRDYSSALSVTAAHPCIELATTASSSSSKALGTYGDVSVTTRSRNPSPVGTYENSINPLGRGLAISASSNIPYSFGTYGAYGERVAGVDPLPIRDFDPRFSPSFGMFGYYNMRTSTAEFPTPRMDVGGAAVRSMLAGDRHDVGRNYMRQM